MGHWIHSQVGIIDVELIKNLAICGAVILVPGTVPARAGDEGIRGWPGTGGVGAGRFGARGAPGEK